MSKPVRQNSVRSSADQHKTNAEVKSKRKSKEQRTSSTRDREEPSPDSSKSKTEEKRGAKTKRTHKSSPDTAESKDKGQTAENDRRERTRSNQKQIEPFKGKTEDKPQRSHKNPASERAIGSRHDGKDHPDKSKIKAEGKRRPSTKRTQESVPNNQDNIFQDALCAGKSGANEKSPRNPGTAKGHARNAEMPEQQKTAKKSVTRGRSVDDDEGKVLNATLKNLKIKQSEKSTTSRCVNGITDKLIADVKQKLSWCKDIVILKTGSYYENVKICAPDEFDVMLAIPVERVDIQKFDEDGAFYSVALKRHPKRPLEKFLNEDRTIRASEMLNEFRKAVKEIVPTLSYEADKVELDRKKKGCPAVTLQVTDNGKIFSVDYVLGLEVRTSWPDFTQKGFKIEKWLGTKERKEQKWKPFYLVPKYKGNGNREHEGVAARDAWRISFSHVEKHILKKHGNSKTCCEAKGQKCCRKACLKLLKYLLSQLTENHPKEMEKFYSYHAKTTLLHACATRVTDDEWAYSRLGDCFQQLLEDFVKHLRDRHLPNFFIPSQNLLNVDKKSCDFLAQQIEKERNNNFPIFSQSLQ